MQCTAANTLVKPCRREVLNLYLANSMLRRVTFRQVTSLTATRIDGIDRTTTNSTVIYSVISFLSHALTVNYSAFYGHSLQEA